MKHLKKFNESKFNEEEFRKKVAQSVANGGWSSIKEIVDLVDINDLRGLYNHLDEESDEEIN